MNLAKCFTKKKSDNPMYFKGTTPGVRLFFRMFQVQKKEQFHSLQDKLIQYVMDNCKKGKGSYTSSENILEIDISKYKLLVLTNTTYGKGSDKATTSLSTADMRRYNAKLKRYLDRIDNLDDSLNIWCYNSVQCASALQEKIRGMGDSEAKKSGFDTKCLFKKNKLLSK